MSLHEKLNEADAADQATRVLITPACNQQDDLDDGSVSFPLSARAYAPLFPVNLEQIQKAAAMRDDENAVITPIGGQISLGYVNQFGEQILDDLVPVPKFGTILMPSQIPMMVDEKPGTEHDPFKEHDFGRLPTYSDYVSSAEGQEKAVEQVLGVPAREFLNAMLAVPESEVRPNELNEAVYLALNFIKRGWCEKDTRYIQPLPYIVFFKKVKGKYKIFVYQRGKGVGEERLALGCSIGVGGHINPIDFLSMQSTYTTERMPGGPILTSNFTGRMLSDSFWGGILNNVIREGREEIQIRQQVGSTMEMDSDIYVKYESRDIVDIIFGGAQAAMISPEQWLHQRTCFFLDYAAGEVEKTHLAMFIAIEVPEDYEISTNEEELIDVGFRDLDELRDDSQVPTPLECWSRSIITSLTETLDHVALNPHQAKLKSRFISDSLSNAGVHPSDPEAIARIPAEDRWKIGTISQIFDTKLKFYAMNAFLRA